MHAVQNVLLLLYLLLERHAKLFRAAQNYNLAYEELFQAVKVIVNVESAVKQRVQAIGSKSTYHELSYVDLISQSRQLPATASQYQQRA